MAMAVEPQAKVGNGHASRIQRLTMAQAVVRYLTMQYSERDGIVRRFIPGIFGIFGHGNVAGLGQALTEYGQDLPYYQPRNEQSMVHTAVGYAKAMRRNATLACTASIGPGSTNMITGAALATINRLPVLLFASDYYATRHQGPVLQQLEHPISRDVSVNDCFRPVCRFFDRITRPEHLLQALPEAMRVLTDAAETGAVTLALPQDIQDHAYDYPSCFFEKRIWQIERTPPVAARLEEATRLLKAARRPIIIAGGGVIYSEAWNELKLFAEDCGIPVGETFGGKGALREPSPMLLGGCGVTGVPPAGHIMAKADLVIAIGTRLTDFTTGSQSAFNCEEVKFISINVCAADAHKQGSLAIKADAREALRAWLPLAKAAGIRPEASYMKEISGELSDWNERLNSEVYVEHPGEAMSQGRMVQIMNEEALPGDVIIAAAGSPPGDLHKLWDVSQDRECQLEFGFSCMGYEIPAGLGARMARTEGEVYVFIGDGTYLMNPTELVTAMQEGLKITIMLSENHGFQVIRQLQMARAGHSFGNEFRKRDLQRNRLEGDYLQIDFAKNAESMGARAWKCRTPEELRQAMREARSETRSCMIVVETEKHRYLPWSEVWWDVAPAEISNDPVVQDLRREYEANRAKLQRYHY